MNILKATYDYKSYRRLIKKRLENGLSTFENDDDELYQYSILNDKRMDRLDKTIHVKQDTINFIKSIKEQQKWTIITEGWCGDAAQNLPVLAKITDINDNISLEIVLRDQHKQLMEKHLTNGAKAIPKLIIDKEDGTQLVWGPRPSSIAKFVKEYKKEYGKVDAQCKKQVQLLYNKDKGTTLQKDIIDLLK